MEGLVKGEVEVNMVFPVPMWGHIGNPFFEYFDFVEEDLFFFFNRGLFIADLVHEGVFSELSVGFDFSRLTEVIKMAKNVLALGNESMIVVLFVFSVKQMIVTHVFVFVFGVAVSCFNCGETDIMSVQEIF